MADLHYNYDRGRLVEIFESDYETSREEELAADAITLTDERDRLTKAMATLEAENVRLKGLLEGTRERLVKWAEWNARERESSKNVTLLNPATVLAWLAERPSSPAPEGTPGGER